ncbi:hypothetical protein SAY87_007054 [Trapa incisa]|uniref:GATA-type domain-containing protein n=1 Tax=Trapa incisa TaxID=236973 RepID=A0AAN7K0L7_9MYRT|nr:hypothetical protein SAY87_007054 [Trapa incisa]
MNLDQDGGGPSCHKLQPSQLGSKDGKALDHQEDQLDSPDDNYASDAASPPNLFEKNQKHDDDQEDQGDYCNSTKWLPTKIRILRKMMNSTQASGKHMVADSAPTFEIQEQLPSPSVDSDESSKGSSYKNSDNATIRVCSNCNTTKTPLWRSGPRGPKSLCNACGIRQRKARRALAAASASASASGSNVLPPANSSVMIKAKGNPKRPKNDHHPDGPRFKFKAGRKDKAPPSSSTPSKKSSICYKDFSWRILSKQYSAYHKVFPQDEREAAILLMALSYGLVHG